MPRKEPTTLPRKALGMMRLNSGQVGQRLILPLKGERSSPESMFLVISAMPKQPSAMLTMPMPSARKGRSMVKRCWPEFTSVPIWPRSTPIRHMARPFSRLPVVTKDRPTSVPTVHPMAQYIRLCSVRACEKPNARLWMTSMSVQGQVHAEEFREHERHQAQADGDLDVALPGVVLAGDGGDEHHHDDRD